jgi:hypothetical protein
MLDPHWIRVPARFRQVFVGWHSLLTIDIPALQPLPAQPFRQSRLFEQYLECHVLEINIFAHVLEQSYIQQNLELIKNRHTTVLVSLLVSPKPNAGINNVLPEQICSGSVRLGTFSPDRMSAVSCTLPECTVDPENIPPWKNSTDSTQWQNSLVSGRNPPIAIPPSGKKSTCFTDLDHTSPIKVDVDDFPLQASSSSFLRLGRYAWG